MIWLINHFYSKYPVLVLSTLNESPTDDGHERTYVELLKEYFYGFSDIVDGLGGFIRMLPPTGVEYGKLLKRWLAARNLAFGNEGIYDALGEIFLTEGLTVIYRNLLVFLESCYQKYGANLTAKAMLEELYLKVNGREMDITDEDRRRVSFHEAGHAFVQEYFGNKSVLATIVPRGNYGGFVMPSRRNSKGLVKEEDWRNKICTSLAGRAAEQVLYFKDLSIRTAGAGGSDGSDLAHASRDAYAMVAILGMGSKLFMPLDRLFGNDDLWNKECMDEADHILHEEMNYTQRIIDANRDIVEKIAKLLEKEGTITANQIEECFEGSEITRLPREIAQAI